MTVDALSLFVAGWIVLAVATAAVITVLACLPLLLGLVYLLGSAFLPVGRRVLRSVQSALSRRPNE